MKIKSLLTATVLVTAVLFCLPAAASATALTSAQVSAIVSLLQSFGADATTVANVQTALTGAAPVVPTPTTWCYTFNNNMSVGSRISLADANALETVLEKQGLITPPDSFSLDVPQYGKDIASAVSKFQAAQGWNPTGGVGPLTRAKLNSLYGCSTNQSGVPVAILQYFMGEYNKSSDQIKVTIGKQEGNYISGGVQIGSGDPSTGGSGGYFFAVQTNGIWKVVYDGNGTYCDAVAPYNFPADMITDCSSNQNQPTITSITPAQGSSGNTITIYGTNLLGTTMVGFYYPGQGYPIASISSQSLSVTSTSIVFTLPQSFDGMVSAGTYNVMVITPSGKSNVVSFNHIVPSTQPSINIQAIDGNQSSSTALNVKIGDTFTISGTPQGLQGLSYWTGLGNPPAGYYNVALSFDQNFGNNNFCGNNSLNSVNGPWIMTCTAKVAGSSNFYFTIFTNGQSYRSNTVMVTILSQTQSPIVIYSPVGGDIINNLDNSKSIKYTVPEALQQKTAYWKVSLVGLNSGQTYNIYQGNMGSGTGGSMGLVNLWANYPSGVPNGLYNVNMTATDLTTGIIYAGQSGTFTITSSDQPASLTNTQINALVSLADSFGINYGALVNLKTALNGGNPPSSGSNLTGSQLSSIISLLNSFGANSNIISAVQRTLWSSSLTVTQASAITDLIRSFGANSMTISNVQIVLSGGTAAYSTNNLTNSQKTAIISLLQSFGASSAIITGVNNVLTLPSPSGLTSSQISAMLGLLNSFGANSSIMNNVELALNGAQCPGAGTGATPTSLTASQQQAITSLLQSFGANTLIIQGVQNAMNGGVCGWG